MFDRAYLNVVLTFVGVLAGAGVTLITGVYAARRQGVTSVSLAEIGDRDKFRKALMDMVDKATKRADDAQLRADMAEQRADHAEQELAELRIKMDLLEARIARQENGK